MCLSAEADATIFLSCHNSCLRNAGFFVPADPTSKNKSTSKTKLFVFIAIKYNIYCLQHTNFIVILPHQQDALTDRMLGRSLTLMGFVSAEMRGTKVKLALGLDEYLRQQVHVREIATWATQAAVSKANSRKG